MRKAVLVVALLLLPSALLAQGALQVSSIDGKVEWRAASARTFVPLKIQATVQAGDELRTGPGSSVILSVPDGSWMVVSENSKLVVDDFWSGNFKSLVNVIMGQVRFYIQRFGGRPNPYSVRTPTALIAVRGTTFEVLVDDGQFSEVRCLEGRVTVENPSVSDREVILEPGHKTFVRAGEAPLTPMLLGAGLNKSRAIHVRGKQVPDVDGNGIPSLDGLRGDNDRRNRTSDPQPANSRMNDNGTQRAKPTLTFPQ